MILRFNRSAELTFPNGGVSPKVAAIKAVRNATEYGLKESKEFVEIAMDNGEAVYTLTKLSRLEVSRLNGELPYPFSAITSDMELADALETAIKVAVKQRNYAAAHALIEMLPDEIVGVLPGRVAFAAD